MPSTRVLTLYGRDRDERDYVNNWDVLFSGIDASASATIANELIESNQDFLFERLLDSQPWFQSNIKGFSNSHAAANSFIQQNPKLKQAFLNINEAAAAKALSEAVVNDFNKLIPVVMRYRPAPSSQAALAALRTNTDRLARIGWRQALGA